MKAETSAQANCKYLRGISASLHVASFDPEGDIQAVVLTFISLGIGGLFGTQWDNLAGTKGKENLMSWGLPSWVADWGWFVACGCISRMLSLVYVQYSGPSVDIKDGIWQREISSVVE